jgi:adenylate cyclase class 2
MADTDAFEEIECKFLDIDAEGLERQLKDLGAERRFSRLFRRYVFDYPDLRLNAESAWLRVRDEGDRVTMSFKQRLGVKPGGNDDGMKEIEVTVSDFEKMAALLEAIGMKPKFYEENRRTAYELDGVEVVIDEWPLIPPYVEIEGPSWEEVDEVAGKLGYEPSDKVICSTMQVYEKYGISESDYRILTFDRQIKK